MSSVVQTARSDVQALRAYLRAKAPFLGTREGLATGSEGLDQILNGGFPKGALTVVTGQFGSGRLTLAAQALAQQTRQSRPVAWVDAAGLVYPPALEAQGVDLGRLLMVQGAGEKGAYAAEQIIDTGAFPMVVVSGLDAHLDAARARRLQTASEGAQVSTLLVLEPPAAQRVQGAALKLHLTRRAHHIQVEVEKDRSGHAYGRRFHLEAV